MARKGQQGGAGKAADTSSKEAEEEEEEEDSEAEGEEEEEEEGEGDDEDNDEREAEAAGDEEEAEEEEEGEDEEGDEEGEGEDEAEGEDAEGDEEDEAEEEGPEAEEEEEDAEDGEEGEGAGEDDEDEDGEDEGDGDEGEDDNEAEEDEEDEELEEDEEDEEDEDEEEDEEEEEEEEEEEDDEDEETPKKRLQKKASLKLTGSKKPDVQKQNTSRALAGKAKTDGPKAAATPKAKAKAAAAGSQKAAAKKSATSRSLGGKAEAAAAKGGGRSAARDKYRSLRGTLLKRPEDQKALAALSALREKLGKGEEEKALACEIQATEALAAGLAAAARGDWAVAAGRLEEAAKGGECAGAAAAEAHLHLAQDRFAALLAEGRRSERRAKKGGGAEAGPSGGADRALRGCREAASRALEAAAAARARLAEEPEGRRSKAEAKDERRRLEEVEKASAGLLQKLEEASTQAPPSSEGGPILVCRAGGALPDPDGGSSSSDDSGVESEAESAEERRKAKAKDSILKIFRHWDVDGDGHISEPELTIVLLKVGFDKETVGQLFRAVDVDGDGRLDYGEFFDWVFGGGGAGVPGLQSEHVNAKPEGSDGALDDVRQCLLQDRRLAPAEGEGGARDPAAAPQPAIANCKTEALVDAAVSSLVPTENARHPDRAEAGSKLIRNASAPADDQASDQELVRGLFFDSMPKTHVAIDRVEGVARPELLKRFLAKVAEDRSCVEATFHGTKEESIPGILQAGLSTRHCSVGLYGSGAYVGTHAGLAHKYTLPNGNGRRHMFVVLVDVGPEVVEGERGKRMKKTAVDRLANPTQYCLFAKDRLFVSHLITYHVKKNKDGGPFTRELSRAIVRAGERARKRGSL